jgi:adenylate kinase
MPPKNDSLCDRCAVALFQRPDDNEETVKNRLRVYLKESQAVLDHYKLQGKLEDVSGDLDAEDVYKVISNKVAALLNK